MTDPLGCDRQVLCRWPSAADEVECASEAPLGFWLAASRPFASIHPEAVPDGNVGACIAMLDQLSCDAASRDECTGLGASCDVVAARQGGSTSMCRWSFAGDEAQCLETAGVWVGKGSAFALEHAGTVAPGAEGACVAALAGPSVSTELCFDLENEFRDNGGDFPAAGERYPARGIRFRLTDAAGTANLYEADPLTGCMAVDLTAFETYRVTLLSSARFADGNEVILMADDVESLVYEWTAPAGLIPALLPRPSITYTWPSSPVDGSRRNVATMLSAFVHFFSGHALTRDGVYRIYVSRGPCSGRCVALNSAGHRSVFLSGRVADKFMIIHELAYLASILRTGGFIGAFGGDPPDCSLNDSVASLCTDDGASSSPGDAQLGMGTEEYGNCAVANGFADYVTASVWNRSDEADCQYGGVAAFNDCYDPGSAAAACQTDVPQSLPTGFERDWLTTFWAIERQDGCGIPFSTIVDIWASANPTSWGNGDAKAKLLEAAPLLLEGPVLDCFATTLSARIRR